MRGLTDKILGRLDQLAGMAVEETYLYKITAGELLPPVELATGVKIQVVGLETVKLLESVEGLSPEDVEQRLRRGDVCYLAYADDRIAHYSWVQRNGYHRIDTAGIGSEVAEGEYWIYNCRTVDWAKGRRIYPYTLSRILDEHMRHGFLRAIIYTTRSNRASENGILRAGFKQVCTLRSFRLGRRYFHLGRVNQGNLGLNRHA